MTSIENHINIFQDSKASDPDKNPDAMAQSAGSEKDLGADPSATYGTRSRNRTGNPRPNYAEDKDIEMDNYDYYHDKKDRDGTKKGTRQAATTNGNDLSRGPAASRKAAAVADESKSSTPNSAKEANTPTNGSNSSASNHPSRKRKAAGAGSGGGGGGGSAQSASSAPSTKKTGQSNGLSATSWPETNMLSFENCQGRLQNGAMVADDGTVLEPNGKLITFFLPALSRAQGDTASLPLSGPGLGGVGGIHSSQFYCQRSFCSAYGQPAQSGKADDRD